MLSTIRHQATEHVVSAQHSELGQTCNFLLLGWCCVIPTKFFRYFPKTFRAYRKKILKFCIFRKEYSKVLFQKHRIAFVDLFPSRYRNISLWLFSKFDLDLDFIEFRTPYVFTSTFNGPQHHSFILTRKNLDFL